MFRTMQSSSTFAAHGSKRVHRVQRWLPKLLVAAVLLSPLAALAQGTTAKKPPAGGASSASASSATPKSSTTAAASTAAPSANPTAVVATPTGSTGVPTGTTGAMDGATYAVRLRDLEQRINELKEQIRRSHTRLALLSESILSGITAAARAEVTFENEMSSAFRLKRIVALYDGAPLATKTDERDTIGDQKEIPLYAELVQPGDHTLQVLLEYQGNGYGIFSYLKGYKFEVRSSRSFTAIEGKTLSLRVVGYEQGGPTTPLEERPAVRYVEKLQAGVGAAGAKKPETK